MKTIYFILSFLILAGCTSSKNSVSEKKDYTIQYKDDFRSVNEQYEEDFLKSIDATADDKSVIHLTQGYKGEKISAKNNNKTIYSGNPITNLNTEYAGYFSFENNSDVIITDSYSKKQIVIESEKAKKHKHIYVMKRGSSTEPHFIITYSNTLRPIK